MLISSLTAPERFAHIFRELCVLEADEDGLRFDAETVEADRISEDTDYAGVRVTLLAYLERAKIPIQIDIGFGDIVTPAPSEIGYRTLMDFLARFCRPIRKELSLPKNSKPLVKLGLAKTRMKDFYDQVITVSNVRVRRENSRPGDSKHLSKTTN